MAQMTMIQAITDAMRIELSRDPNVLLFGEDVGHYGGVFRATEGLQKEFGVDRVFDTPLSESGICGLAIGLGLQGFRPIAEIQFVGFIFEALDSIIGQAARMRFRSGGRYHSPITFRTPFGTGVKAAEFHSDNLEGILVQSPGLKVVVPSNPYDAKGLLLSSIRDNDPVFFLEHMKLYRMFRDEVPTGDYTVPIGKAKIVREGKDVTVITYGAMVHTCLKAADDIEKQRGTQVEIIDLRTLSPLDVNTIIASVEKTHRAIVVQEAQKMTGIGAEVVAQINELAILHLEAPVLRVTAPDVLFTFPQIEEELVPNAKSVIAALNKVLDF